MIRSDDLDRLPDRTGSEELRRIAAHFAVELGEGRRVDLVVLQMRPCSERPRH